MAHAAGESIPGSKLSHIPENAMRMLVSIRKSDFFFFLVFLELPPRHMEVPRLGVQSEL